MMMQRQPTLNVAGLMAAATPPPPPVVAPVITVALPPPPLKHANTMSSMSVSGMNPLAASSRAGRVGRATGARQSVRKVGGE